MSPVACEVGASDGARYGAADGAACREFYDAYETEPAFIVGDLCEAAERERESAVANTAAAKADDPPACNDEALAEYMRCYDLAYAAAYTAAYSEVCDTGE